MRMNERTNISTRFLATPPRRITLLSVEGMNGNKVKDATRILASKFHGHSRSSNHALCLFCLRLIRLNL